MALTTRQKILIPTLTIVAILLIWQLYLMVQDRYPVDSPFTHSKELSLASQDPAPVIHLPEKSVNDPITVANADPKSVANSPDPAASQQQAAYLQLVSEYQIAQIKRMIARDYEDIAVANRNTAKAMLEISNMTGAKSIPQVSLNTTPAENVDQDYRLVYTSREGDDWAATLRYQGKLLDIKEGTVLPDGAKVIAIDSTSVALGNADKQLLITFLGTTNIPIKPQATTTVVEQPQPQAISSTKIIKPLNVSTADDVTSKPLQLTVTHTSDADIKEVKPAQSNAVKSPEIKLSQTTQTKTITQTVASTKPLTNHVVNHTTLEQHSSVVNSKEVVVAQTTKSKPEVKAELHVQSKAKSETTSKLQVQSKTKSDAKAELQAQSKPKSETKSKLQAQSKSKSETKAELHTQSKAKSETTSKFRVQSKTKSEAKPVLQVQSKPSRHYTQMEKSLLQVAPNYYTIQLMSNSDLSVVKSCIASNHLVGQARFYKTYLQGKPWYILLYRQFPTAQSALSAISELPINLQRWSPFAKSYVRVHEELQATA